MEFSPTPVVEEFTGGENGNFVNIDLRRLVPRCIFHLRSEYDGAYGYHEISLSSPGGYFGYPLAEPPAVGDLVWLHDRLAKRARYFRVVDRSWTIVDYGSVEWPAGEDYPKVGPRIDIIVERVIEGPFIDGPAPAKPSCP